MKNALLSSFKSFYIQYPHYNMDSLIQFYCVYSGAGHSVSLDPFSSLEESVLQNFTFNLVSIQENISPSYLSEEPYLSLLKSVSRSDGKVSNILRRAKLGSKLGEKLIAQLVDLNILFIEKSREEPIRKSPKDAIKKTLRGYKIEPKIRFLKPFFRFWFAFVEPYRSDLLRGETTNFIDNFNQHKDKVFYIVFEQLSSIWLENYYELIDPIVSKGGFWDYKNEFDILHVSTSGTTILGECKFKSKKVTAKELVKLKRKARDSGIDADKYILFSRSGFSNELYDNMDKNLILCSLDELSSLLN